MAALAIFACRSRRGGLSGSILQRPFRLPFGRSERHKFSRFSERVGWLVHKKREGGSLVSKYVCTVGLRVDATMDVYVSTCPEGIYLSSEKKRIDPALFCRMRTARTRPFVEETKPSRRPL